MSEELDIDEMLQALITTYDEPGKGRKQCPDCKKYVGARQSNCACGHKFKPEDKKTRKPQEETDPMIAAFVHKTGKSHRERVVDFPSGSCPAKLTDTSKEGVDDWCNQVLWNGRNKGLIYTPNAMTYFLRHYVSVYDPQYKELKEKVKDWANNFGELHANY